MIGSVPLGLIITQFCSSKTILIPSVVSEFGISSFSLLIIFCASSFEQLILVFDVKDGGKSSTNSDIDLLVFASNYKAIAIVIAPSLT